MKKKSIYGGKLVYSGKLLKDENKLSEYFYKEGDIIILIQAKIDIVNKSCQIKESEVEETNKNNLLSSTNNLIKNNIDLLKNNYDIFKLNDDNKKEVYGKVSDPDFLIKLLSFINKDNNKDNNNNSSNNINDYIELLNFSDEDKKNIDIFIELGYNKEEISQIYLACNKNKKLTENILKD